MKDPLSFYLCIRLQENIRKNWEHDYSQKLGPVPPITFLGHKNLRKIATILYKKIDEANTLNKEIVSSKTLMKYISNPDDTLIQGNKLSDLTYFLEGISLELFQAEFEGQIKFYSNKREFYKTKIIASDQATISDLFKSLLYLYAADFETIEIDAVGVRQEKLMKALTEFISKNQDFKFQSRILLYKPNSPALEDRWYFQHRKDKKAYHHRSALAIKNWEELRDEYDNFEMKLLQPTIPLYYYVRIANSILITPYSVGSGYTRPSMLIHKSTDPVFFASHKKHFLLAFKREEELSDSQ